MKLDTATCPECRQTFTITRYGRKVPCPHCDEALDIAPDPLPPMYKRIPFLHFTPLDWRQVIQAQIQYLKSLEMELREDTLVPGAGEQIRRIREEVNRIGSIIF